MKQNNGYENPQAPVKDKKSNGVIIVLACILAAVLIGGGLYYFFFRDEPSDTSETRRKTTASQKAETDDNGETVPDTPAKVLSAKDKDEIYSMNRASNVYRFYGMNYDIDCSTPCKIGDTYYFINYYEISRRLGQYECSVRAVSESNLEEAADTALLYTVEDDGSYVWADGLWEELCTVSQIQQEDGPLTLNLYIMAYDGYLYASDGETVLRINPDDPDDQSEIYSGVFIDYIFAYNGRIYIRDQNDGRQINSVMPDGSDFRLEVNADAEELGGRFITGVFAYGDYLYFTASDYGSGETATDSVFGRAKLQNGDIEILKVYSTDCRLVSDGEYAAVFSADDGHVEVYGLETGELVNETKTDFMPGDDYYTSYAYASDGKAYICLVTEKYIYDEESGEIGDYDLNGFLYRIDMETGDFESTEIERCISVFADYDTQLGKCSNPFGSELVTYFEKYNY